MKNRKLIITVSILVAVIAVVTSLVLIKTQKEDNNVVVETNTVELKEDVVIIDDDTKKNKQPYKIDANHLYYKKEPELSVNDVIVSGITEAAPNGYIRKVTKISNVDGQYVVETIPATFLEVFEELDLKAIVPLTEDTQQSNISNNAKATLNAAKLFNFGVIEAKAATAEMLDINEELDENLGPASVKGKVGASATLEVNIDIQNNEIVWSSIVTDKIYGDLFVGVEKSADKTFQKTLASIEKAVTIMAGPVPIVISNELALELKGNTGISGELGTNININTTDKNGFIYTSVDGSIVEINESESFAGDINCETGSSADGEFKVGIFIDLTSLFYDCSGAEMGVGVEGKTEGKLSITDDTLKTEEKFYGKITASIYPKLYGNIVVNIPVIDHDLVEIELFAVEFDPLWEKTFEYGGSAKASKLKDNIDTQYLMKILGTFNLLPYKNTNQIYYGDNAPPKYTINEKTSFTTEVWHNYIQTVVIMQYAMPEVDFYQLLETKQQPKTALSENGSTYAYYPINNLTKYLDAIGYDISELENDEYSYYDSDTNEYVIAVDGLGGFFENYYCEFISSRVEDKNNKLIVQYKDYYNNYATGEEHLVLKEVYLTAADNTIGYTIDKVETVSEYNTTDIENFLSVIRNSNGKLPWEQ